MIGMSACIFVTLEPTAVTNLTATATSFQSILVMWDLPLNPNGPIGSYRVFHRESDTVQTPPIDSNQYAQTTVTERQLEIITGLTAFTNYSIHVQAIGTGGTPGGTLQGDVDEEVLQRTFTTTPPHRPRLQAPPPNHPPPPPPSPPPLLPSTSCWRDLCGQRWSLPGTRSSSDQPPRPGGQGCRGSCSSEQGRYVYM